MNLRILFISVFLFGMYSRFHLNGPVFVPYIFCLISGIMLLMINQGRVNKKSLSFIMIISVVSVVVTGLTILTQDVIAREIVESLIYFIYSIALSVLLFEEMLKSSNAKLAEYFYKVVLFTLALCVLDVLTPFHEISLFVIDLFGGDNLSEYADRRDAAYFFGVRRPYPFTKEPSHVSKFLLIVLSGWMVLSPKKNYRLFYILVLISMVIVRSPIVLAAIPVILYYQLIERKARKNLLVFSSRLIVVGVLFVVAVIFGYIMLESRINSVMRGGDGSTYVRLFRPYLILFESLAYSPMLGVGIANKAKLAELYLMNHNFWIDSALGTGYTVNALVAPITYWGILGSILHISVLTSYISKRVTLGYKTAFGMLLFMLLISMGDINTVDALGYIMIIIRIFTINKSDNKAMVFEKYNINYT